MELKSNATVLFMVLHQCVGLDEAIQKISHATKTFPCNENYVLALRFETFCRGSAGVCR
jgi:hypothetical protein